MGKISPSPNVLVKKAKGSLPILYDSPRSSFFYVILFTTPPPYMGSSLPNYSLESWRFRVLGLCVVWLHNKSQGFYKTKRGSWFIKLRIWWWWQSPPCSLQWITKLLLETSFAYCSCDRTCVFHYSLWMFIIPNLILKSCN